MRKVVIILPTYNEAKTITEVVKQIFNIASELKNWEIHVLVVDSSSPDKTGQIVQELTKIYKNLYLLTTPKEGLGKAYIRGFQWSIDHLQPYLIFEMDADLSHNPTDIPRFLNTISQGADFVVGSRYIKGGSIPKDWSFHRKLFSICGNWIIRLGFMKLKITDWTDGFRAIKVWVIKNTLSHLNDYTGYVFQVALLDKALKMNARVVEIPVNFIDRREGVSKINSGQYILNIILYILTHSPFIKFVVVGLTGFVVDFALSYLGIELLHFPIWLTTIISTETAIFTNFTLNNFWSFSHKKISGEKKEFFTSFVKFNLVSSGSIAIQTIGVQLLSNAFGRNYWYIYKILIITFIIIPYSYILYNKIVWKEKQN